MESLNAEARAGQAKDGMAVPVERAVSNASSVRTVKSIGTRLCLPAIIRLRGSPPIDIGKCRPQLQRESIPLPDDWKVAVQADDHIDALHEECFTLDSFDRLIQTFRNAKKDFILARVMTIDPNDPTKTYWSYYSGHHINKVLFRTQPEQFLLHRMRCRNPLNNMVIVGEVHYFLIEWPSVDAAQAEYERVTGQRLHRSQSVLGKMADSKAVPLQVLAKSLSATSLLSVHQPEPQPNTPSTAHVRQKTAPQISAKHTSIEYTAKYIGSDEDFLQRQNFRDVFTANALNPGDAEIFPLTAAAAASATRERADTAAETRYQPNTPSCRNLGGLLYWPPRHSYLLSRGGIVHQYTFAVICVGALTIVLATSIVAFPIFLMFITLPLTVAGLILMALTTVHFSET